MFTKISLYQSGPFRLITAFSIHAPVIGFQAVSTKLKVIVLAQAPLGASLIKIGNDFRLSSVESY
ncbi:TPA: hypothetical protein DEG21_05285 [Patescibacteria group bacterium]|nr:hypothetical protein [Candidatus Gracilibacteria bacterium]HBY75242.1 hypothetical protein [Candidatus Gracilibacteria bacterium]